MDFNDALRKVLEQSKYDNLTGRAFDWRAWLRDRIVELLTRLLENININFGSLFQPGSGGWVNSWMNVLRIAGVVFLVFIAVRLAIYFWRRIKRRRNSSGGVFEGIDKENATARGLLEAGARLASDGYPRDAVRYCLAAILLALDRKKIYRLNYTKTNGQILRELRGRAPSVIPALTAIVDVFNAVWFGHRNMSKTQFDKYLQESASLVAEVEAYKQK